jgi:hypothetical protein
VFFDGLGNRGIAIHGMYGVIVIRSQAQLQRLREFRVVVNDQYFRHNYSPF